MREVRDSRRRWSRSFVSGNERQSNLDPRESDSATLQELTDIGCLVLLGAAGCGKTTDITTEERRLRAARGFVVKIPLHTIRGAGDLESEIGRKSVELEHEITSRVGFFLWQDETSQPFYLLLDGLDESGVDIRRLCMEVVQFLEKHREAVAGGRLRLRVTSRPTAFPQFLREELGKLYGPSSTEFQIRQMLPLEDTEIRTELANRDPVVVSRLLMDRNVASILASPLGLSLLENDDVWNAVAHHGTQGRCEFFEEATRVFLTEPNENRDSAPDPEIARAIAGLVATLMLLSGRPLVRLPEATVEGPTDNYLDLSDIVQPSSDASLDMSAALVSRVLQHRPMFELNEGYAAFVHRGLMEFVAASFLAHQRPVQQIRDLLSSDDVLVPQLHGLTAWLLSLDVEVLDLLLDDETVPGTLFLGCDLKSFESTRRRKIIQFLLKYAGSPAGCSSPWRYDFHAVPHWDCSELEDEVCVALNSREMPQPARETAVWLVRMARVRPLVAVLLDTARSPAEETHTRVEAVRGVAELGSAEDRSQLLELARGAESDSDDELKGHALSAIWPRIEADGREPAGSIADLLKCLTPRKRRSFFGAYASFLFSLPERLLDSHWPSVLGWLEEQAATLSTHRAWHDYGWDFEDLLVAACNVALARIDEKEMVDPLARIAIHRMLAYQSPLPASRSRRAIGQLSHAQRRMIVSAIVSAWPTQDKTNEIAFRLLRGEGTALLCPSDWPFVVEQASHENAGSKWLELVKGMCRFGGFSEWPLPTGNEEIDGFVLEFKDQVERNRELWQKEERERAAEADAQDQADDATPKISANQRICDCLEAIANANLNAWWRLCFFMTDSGDGNVHFDDSLNLPGSPGWASSDSATKSEILSSARRFLDEERELSNAWLDGTTVPYAVAGGLQAWFLLLDEDVSRLPTDIEVWRRWVDVMVRWPFTPNGREVIGRFRRLIAEAAQRMPEEVRDSLATALREGPVEWDLFLGRYTGLWTQELCDDALNSCEKLKVGSDGSARSTQSSRIRYAAHTLANDEPALVIDWLHRRINDHSDTWAAQVAGILSVPKLTLEAWKLVGTGLLERDDLLIRVLKLICGGALFDSGILAELPDDDQAEILLRLERMFPWKSDAEDTSDDFHVVTDGESLREFRNRLLVRLRDKGTRLAVVALEKYVRRVSPEGKNLAERVLAEARNRMHREVWEPRTPAEVNHILDQLCREDAK
jgi:hypothetical protein